MKLPIPHLSFGKKQPKKAYFLCLLLRDEQISAYILEETNGQLQLVSKQEEVLPASIEQETPEQWLEILDRIISKAEEALPKDILTHKTMFGVKEGWVEDKKIKKEYLTKMKQVCDSLDLQPIGFLVITEAIAHQMQEEEGAPLTAILVEIGKQKLTVSHIRAGRIIETQHTAIIESPAQTVDALLKHFTSVTVLPSRIVVYDGINTDQIVQDFISHQWSKSLPFLHMPQITSLPHGFDAQSVILGAAEQMGLQVSNLNLNMLPAQSKNDEGIQNSPVNMPSAAESQTLAQQFSQNFSDEDIPQKQEPAASLETYNENTKIVPAETLGFFEEKDVADIPQTQSLSHDQEKFLQQNPETKSKTKRSLPGISFLSGTGRRITSGIGSIFSKKPRIAIAGQSIPRWLYILPVILVLICAGIGWYIFQVQATVTLHLKPKVVQEQGNMTFSTANGNNFSNNTVSAKDLSVDINGSVSTNTTGKKNVGTPAKGTVTLYNNSSSSVQLSSGSTITSSNNLVFILDNDVSVASASGDIFSGTKPGTTDVNVTAKDIGTNYNLPSGTTFSVSGTSDVAAKNNAAFTGGTEKQVTVVSQVDLNKLAGDLPTNLQDKAKQQLQEKLNSDESLLPDITSTSLSNKVYSAKVNDSASSVTLKATVTFHEMAYNNTDLQQLGMFLLKDKFTDNEALSGKGITADVSNEKVADDNTVNANIDLKAGLLPQLNKQKLLGQITGKSVTDAQTLLSGEPQVESSTITLQPNIPFIPKLLPRFPNHIHIQVQSND